MSEWRLGQLRSPSGGAVWKRARRSHPEAPGHTQEVVGRTVGELEAALAVHDHLDRLREKHGHAWVIGADEVMPTWRIRWVWAQPRAPGAPAPPPVDTPAELEALLAARTAREEAAP
ncbi:hypothetical protein [Nocardiopsis baichengensis]|uniref:hypothetical protein n=1 Tax=Nocardiopsis baichengensis TaxID=280240 RepID=UPI000347309F|nr:hypothetical protein [Nocardiopsis baichengensis]